MCGAAVKQQLYKESSVYKLKVPMHLKSQLLVQTARITQWVFTFLGYGNDKLSPHETSDLKLFTMKTWCFYFHKKGGGCTI